MKEIKSLGKIVIVIITLILTGCTSLPGPTANQPMASHPLTGGQTALWDGNSAETWKTLQHTSTNKLIAMQKTTTSPIQLAWIDLALISKRNSIDTQQIANELTTWRAHNPDHPGNSLFPDNITLNQLTAFSSPRQIAVLLPQRGMFAASGRTIREGFLNAYYANLYKVGKQSVKFYDTSQTQDMHSLYQKAIADGADIVIGPLVKTNVQQLKTANAFPTPTLALNYGDQGLAPLPKNFFEFGLLPEDEAVQLAQRARKSGLQNAIIIAPQNLWGKRLVNAFSTHWVTEGGSIRDTWYYTSRATFNQEIAHLLNIDPNIDKKLMQEGNDKLVLEQQRRQDFDVIILFSQPQDARVIVPLLRYYYANNIPIFATSSIYSGKPNPAKDIDLNGVIVCDIPWSMEMARNTNSDATQSDRLYAVGQDAYLLSQTLTRLMLLPNFPIYGTTGALTLSSTRQIHRRLPCMVIRNGVI